MCTTPEGRLHDLMKMEWQSLRSEEEFLKRCQLQYFLFSITVVGLFVGLSHLEVPGMQPVISEHSWVFLTPLIITIPCWWIFFDKCKTIARLVAYLRVLEALALSDDREFLKLYLGWETSMGLFRDKFSKGMERNPNVHPHIPIEKRPWKILTFDTDHKYWVAHYYCFLFVSLICLIIAWKTITTDPTTYILSLLVVLANAVVTFKMLERLLFGQDSHNAHEKEWWTLLRDARKNKTSQSGMPPVQT
jgi:hypothetical protein